MLRASGISVRKGRALPVRDASLDVMPGEVTALLGPNGAGKSTLLEALSGDIVPVSGDVRLDAVALDEIPREGLARRRAVMGQLPPAPFGFTAREIVELGRYPHADAPEERDAIVAQSLEAADVGHLAERTMQSLSGGERSRVHFARALAQIGPDAHALPRYLLLDEPAASLDPHQQHRVLGLAREAARERNVGVLVVLHDVNLAAAYADRCILMREARIIEAGPTREVLSPATLEACYGIAMHAVSDVQLAWPCFVAIPAHMPRH